MFNLHIYKKIYHNNLELKEIYTMHSKQVHNMYRFMYHYICKLRINLISQYFPLSWEIWVFPAYLPILWEIHSSQTNQWQYIYSKASPTIRYCYEKSILVKLINDYIYSKASPTIRYCYEKSILVKLINDSTYILRLHLQYDIVMRNLF
jgi:hypothetical protein